MSVGIVTTKTSLDSQAGTLAQQIATWARQAANLETFLAGMPDAELQTLGYSADDVALLKSAAADMSKLASLYRGEVDQTPAYDFRTFTLRIAGLQI